MQTKAIDEVVYYVQLPFSFSMKPKYWHHLLLTISYNVLRSLFSKGNSWKEGYGSSSKKEISSLGHTIFNDYRMRSDFIEIVHK